MRNLQKKGNLEKAAGSTLNKTLFIRELDISKEDSITKFLKETYGNEGRVDVLSEFCVHFIIKYKASFPKVQLIW